MESNDFSFSEEIKERNQNYILPFAFVINMVLNLSIAVKPITVNFLRLFAVCGRTRSFLQLPADRILNFLRLELLADKHNLTFCRLHVLAAQELLAPLLVCALFLGCTVDQPL